MDRRRFLQTSLAGALGAPLAAEGQPPIRIGASASKTGTYASLGGNQLRGYQLCVTHTNAKGGVLGRRLELVVDDDRSQPTTAAGIYERLILTSPLFRLHIASES